jgi:hypothetical protein
MGVDVTVFRHAVASLGLLAGFVFLAGLKSTLEK